MRKTYKGGMNICFKYDHVKGLVYYYDFNSFYPDVGCNVMPFGMPIYKDFKTSEHKCTEFTK